jgi:hypothetical protein
MSAKKNRREWSSEELAKIAGADDLKISPLRADGEAYGTPTWIWNVSVGNGLYVRAYNGKRSRWYQSALEQQAGRIHAAGMVKEVVFEVVPGDINNEIDEAYRQKYKGSPYLAHMIGEKSRAATIRIYPRVSTEV